MTPKAVDTPPAEKLTPITAASHPITMTIDIGGSGLKAMLLDAKGRPVSDRERVVTQIGRAHV